jgi:hypothetical protein
MHQLIKYISQIAGVSVPDDEAMSRVCLFAFWLFSNATDETILGITDEPQICATSTLTNLCIRSARIPCMIALTFRGFNPSVISAAHPWRS